VEKTKTFKRLVGGRAPVSQGRENRRGYGLGGKGPGPEVPRLAREGKQAHGPVGRAPVSQGREKQLAREGKNTVSQGRTNIARANNTYRGKENTRRGPG
jgi:hypothetical protein